MNKKISLGYLTAIVISAIAVTAVITVFVSMNIFNGTVSGITERAGMYEILEEVNELAGKNYYGDIGSVNVDCAAADGLVQGLGQGCSVMSESEYKDYKLLKSGMKAGTGITAVFDKEKKCLKITGVADGSSAYKNGLKTGMYISGINSSVCNEKNYKDCIGLLSTGYSGNIKLSVRTFNEGDDGYKDTDYSVNSGYYSPSVTFCKINNFGYIGISAFYDSTVEEFSSAVDKLKNENVTALIFDVRNTSAGSVDNCVKILDMIVPLATNGTKAIAVSMDINGNKKKSWAADSNSLNLNCAVLMNENTSAAAELFCADIRDFGKGKIIGTKSRGDGLYYEEFALSNGGCAVICTGIIHPYTGDEFNETGIVPDIVSEQKDIPSDYGADTQIQRALVYLMDGK